MLLRALQTGSPGAVSSGRRNSLPATPRTRPSESSTSRAPHTPQAVTALRRMVNVVQREEGGADGVAAAERVRYRLRRATAQVPAVPLAFVLQASLSTRCVADLKRVNPHITDEAAQRAVRLLVALQLHSCRVAQTSRAASGASSYLWGQEGVDLEGGAQASACLLSDFVPSRDALRPLFTPALPPSCLAAARRFRWLSLPD